MTQKTLFRAISFLVAIFGTASMVILSEFGNIYTRAVAVAIAFCFGYFINFFQSRNQ